MLFFGKKSLENDNIKEIFLHLRRKLQKTRLIQKAREKHSIV